MTPCGLVEISTIFNSHFSGEFHLFPAQNVFKIEIFNKVSVARRYKC